MLGCEIMASYIIGFIIGSLRNLMGMTMEELAFNFIDPSGISRIESGKRMPDKDTLEAIFQKLGVNPNHLITIFATNKDILRQKATDTLDTCLFNRDIEGATKAIHDLNEMVRVKKIKKDKLFDRYIHAAEIANNINANKYSAEESIDALNDAMELHYPKYNEKRIASYFLTMTDFRTLLMISLLCFQQGDINRGKDILYNLKDNIEKNIIDRMERGRRYPIIIYNLTNELLNLNEYNEVIDLCYQGRKICAETGCFELLPNIASNEADANMGIKNKKAGIRLFLDACHAFRLFGNYEAREVLMDHVINNYDINLDNLMNP